jgi:hypothetical protein
LLLRNPDTQSSLWATRRPPALNPDGFSSRLSFGLNQDRDLGRED